MYFESLFLPFSCLENISSSLLDVFRVRTVFLQNYTAFDVYTCHKILSVLGV